MACFTAESTGRNPGFSLAENTDDLFVGKTLLHGDVLMWLMKTLLTSRCVNQRGAGQIHTRCQVDNPAEALPTIIATLDIPPYSRKMHFNIAYLYAYNINLHQGFSSK